MAGTKICSIDGCSKPLHSRGYCDNHRRLWRKHGDPLINKNPNRGKVLDWLKGHVSFQDADCLIWPFSRLDGGYGRLRYEGRMEVASRLMCRLAHGDPPTPDHEAAHSCGNGCNGCINPKHLGWKTATENGADTIKHGRTTRGTKAHLAKLDEDKVAVIVIRLNNGDGKKTIASDFCVSRTAIRDIDSGKTWGWLTGRAPGGR